MWPKWILDTASGRLWECDLELRAVSQCVFDPTVLIPLVLRRYHPSAKRLVLECVRTMVEERAALSQLAYVFKVLCSAYDAWRSDGGGVTEHTTSVPLGTLEGEKRDAAARARAKAKAHANEGEVSFMYRYI